jgi:hypothetical protein
MDYRRLRWLFRAAQQRPRSGVATFILACSAVNGTALSTLIYGLDRATPGFALWALAVFGWRALVALILFPPMAAWGIAHLLIRNPKTESFDCGS